MFTRSIIEKLKHWSSRGDKNKPLVLRGARQVGKTTLVKIFSESYEKFIYLNLDIDKNKRLFDIHKDVQSLFEAICLQTKNIPIKGNTLLFIDEIQNSPEAVTILRYFYEELSWLDVITAGSMLETLTGKRISFPVGRVEYLPVRPCSFPEFLLATGDQKGFDLLREVPIPDYAHEYLLQQFRTYALLGGMPEIIENFRNEQSIANLGPVYDGLVVSYLDDIEKYAQSPAMVEIIRHTITHSFDAAGSRITLSRFGNSNYRNREMSEAFRTLEKAFLFQLVRPVTTTILPITPNIRRSVKLQLVDTG
ncbi:MAG: ATP-binding protein, partial [Bacteroidales bacterium]|nr:ATP-binding protein [Bacteroidales bacterium]